MPSYAVLSALDRICLDAAEGWLGLGNLVEARSEIEQINAPGSHHPDVLEVRWELAARERQWEVALEVAGRLVEVDPARCSGWLHRSYCLHELKRTLEAWNRLMPAFERFPKEATIPYNLACYACQLGDLEQGQVWLERAVAIRGRKAIKALALEDEDLVPLHGELNSW